MLLRLGKFHLVYARAEQAIEFFEKAVSYGENLDLEDYEYQYKDIVNIHHLLADLFEITGNQEKSGLYREKARNFDQLQREGEEEVQAWISMEKWDEEEPESENEQGQMKEGRGFQEQEREGREGEIESGESEEEEFKEDVAAGFVEIRHLDELIDFLKEAEEHFDEFESEDFDDFIARLERENEIEDFFGEDEEQEQGLDQDEGAYKSEQARDSDHVEIAEDNDSRRE